MRRREKRKVVPEKREEERETRETSIESALNALKEACRAEWEDERRELLSRIATLEGEKEAMENTIAELTRRAGSAPDDAFKTTKRRAAYATFRERFRSRRSADVRKSYKPVLRKYMEELGISQGELSKTRTMRSAFGKKATLSKRAARVAEASSRRRGGERRTDESPAVVTNDSSPAKTMPGMVKKRIGSSVPSGLVRTVRWKSVKRTSMLRGHLAGVRCLSCYSPNETSNSPSQYSTRLVSGGEDGLTKVWSFDDASPYNVCTFRGHVGAVYATEMLTSSTTPLCATGGADGTVRLWALPSTKDVPKGDRLVHSWATLRGHTDVVWSLATHASLGNRLLSASSDGSIRLWTVRYDDKHIQSTTLPQTSMDAIPSTVSVASFDPQKCTYGMRDERGPAIACVDMERSTASVVHRFGNGGADANDAFHIYRIATHPTEPTVISAHEDGRIRLVDVRTGKCEFEIIAHTDAVSCVRIEKRGQHVVSGSHDGSVRIWSLGERKMVQDIPSTHLQHFDEAVHDVTFVDRTLVSAGSDTVINTYQHVNLYP